MLAVDFLLDVRIRLDEESRRMEQTIARGSAQDYADYQRRVGIIEGVALARMAIEEVFKRGGVE